MTRKCHPRPSTADPATANRRFRIIAIGAVGVLAAIAVGVAVRSREPIELLDVATLRVTTTATEVSIADASGASRVIHYVQPGGALVASTPPGSRTSMPMARPRS